MNDNPRAGQSTEEDVALFGNVLGVSALLFASRGKVFLRILLERSESAIMCWWLGLKRLLFGRDATMSFFVFVAIACFLLVNWVHSSCFCQSMTRQIVRVRFHDTVHLPEFEDSSQPGGSKHTSHTKSQTKILNIRYYIYFESIVPFAKVQKGSNFFSWDQGEKDAPTKGQNENNLHKASLSYRFRTNSTILVGGEERRERWALVNAQKSLLTIDSHCSCWHIKKQTHDCAPKREGKRELYVCARSSQFTIIVVQVDLSTI